MAKKPTSVLKELEELDKKRQELLEEAKGEALARAKEAVHDLKELGFEYTLVEYKSSTKGLVSDAPCPICKFKTKPPHDARKHRGQDDKKPFTAAELKELGLAKVT